MHVKAVADQHKEFIRFYQITKEQKNIFHLFWQLLDIENVFLWLATVHD